MLFRSAESEKMHGKTYLGVVSPDILGSCNLWMVVGGAEGTQTLFPISYVMQGRVVGNIFENEDLLQVAKQQAVY